MKNTERKQIAIHYFREHTNNCYYAAASIVAIFIYVATNNVNVIYVVALINVIFLALQIQKRKYLGDKYGFINKIELVENEKKPTEN